MRLLPLLACLALAAAAARDDPVQFQCTPIQQSELATGVTWAQSNWCVILVAASLRTLRAMSVTLTRGVRA